MKNDQPNLVLVHGLWFRAGSLQFLARRMRREGRNSITEAFE